MNDAARTRRKFLYLAIIVVMLVPLYLLGQPATGSAGTRTTGGQLAEMRQEYNLGSADIGEVELSGESMRLATLGMRGVAATLLWQKSHKYERRKEWDRLSATLNQIARLQPHFENVWEHQAHNLTYNVSVEFDDYRQRYEWVKKGTDFLMKGVRRNQRAPRLVWYTGWFVGNKIGIADEKKQFRELFSDDTPFHQDLIAEGIDVDGYEARGPYGKPDNWLVGRLWMKRAYDMVDGGVPLRRKNPVHFFQDAALYRTYHASTIEKEGVLDERAEDAWFRASNDWVDYGNRALPTYDGYTVQLGQYAAAKQQVDDLQQQLDTVVADAREEIRAERRAELSEEAKAALAIPDEERDGVQFRLAEDAMQKIEPTYEEALARLPQEDRLQGLQLLSRLETAQSREQKIRAYQDQTNFVYWSQRAEAEREEDTIRARKLVFDAEQLLEEAELDKALERFEDAWLLWADIFARYPVLAVDSESVDLVESIRRYQRLLDVDELPSDFPLKAFLDVQERAETDPEFYMHLQSQALRQQEQAESAPGEDDSATEASNDEPSAEKKPDGNGTSGENSEPASGSDAAAAEVAEPSAESEESDADENAGTADSPSDAAPSTPEANAAASDADTSGDTEETSTESESDADSEPQNEN